MAALAADAEAGVAACRRRPAVDDTDKCANRCSAGGGVASSGGSGRLVVRGRERLRLWLEEEERGGVGVAAVAACNRVCSTTAGLALAPDVDAVRAAPPAAPGVRSRLKNPEGGSAPGRRLDGGVVGGGGEPAPLPPPLPLPPALASSPSSLKRKRRSAGVGGAAPAACDAEPGDTRPSHGSSPRAASAACSRSRGCGDALIEAAAAARLSASLPGAPELSLMEAVVGAAVEAACAGDA